MTKHQYFYNKLIDASVMQYSMLEKDQIKLAIREESVYPNKEIHGKIIINYDGRYDTIVINSQIEDSSDIFKYTEINGNKINYNYPRISLFKSDLPNPKTVEFSAITTHIPINRSKVKFRTSIIQEHKEIANDVVFLEITKKEVNHKGES